VTTPEPLLVISQCCQNYGCPQGEIRWNLFQIGENRKKISDIKRTTIIDNTGMMEGCADGLQPGRIYFFALKTS